jgi:GABA(A) receptor-associated protein
MAPKEEFEFDKVPVEKRKEELTKQLESYPGKIPVVVQKSQNSKLVVPEKFKFKFLVPQDQNFGGFTFQMRKKLNLSEEQSLFVFTYPNNQIPPSGNTMKDVYDKFKDEQDGFLKLLFSEENSFGSQ